MQKDTLNTIENQIRRLKNITFALVEGELVYILSNRQKKEVPSIFCKSTTDKKSFYNKESRYVVTRRFENHRGTEVYHMQEVERGKKAEGRFLRKELFALKTMSSEVKLILQDGVKVNFKEDVFGLKEFDIATKYDLALIKQDDSVLKYKHKIENNFSDSKY